MKKKAMAEEARTHLKMIIVAFVLSACATPPAARPTGSRAATQAGCFQMAQDTREIADGRDRGVPISTAIAEGVAKRGPSFRPIVVQIYSTTASGLVLQTETIQQCNQIDDIQKQEGVPY
jgi:hypothetical protein